MYVKNKGIVLREPSVVAVNRQTGHVLAAGNEAKRMIGRTPGSVSAIRPLKDGVIADFRITQTMLKYFMKKAVSMSSIFKPRVIVCIPYGITDVEKRAVEEAVYSAGARETYLIEEPMAAAIGAGLPVGEPVGSMVVDIGGGTSEVAVISLGGIVTSQSLRVAGDEMDASIMRYVKKKYNVMLGERTAEEIKINIGAVSFAVDEKYYDVRGRDLITGLPKTISVSTKDVTNALSDCIYSIIEAIKLSLEKTPPELSADILDNGITLTGGGALLEGMNLVISSNVGFGVKVAENPLDCVALGTGKLLDESGDFFKAVVCSTKR